MLAGLLLNGLSQVLLILSQIRGSPIAESCAASSMTNPTGLLVLSMEERNIIHILPI